MGKKNWRYIEGPPIRSTGSGDSYNLVEDAVCPACQKTDTFSVTGNVGQRVDVRLACGHTATWTVIRS